MFDWDEANIAHIAEHDVTPAEAEQVVDNNPLYLDYLIEDGEECHSEIGETLEGRILLVVSTPRGDKVRIITAYTPNRAWRTAYLEFKEFESHGKADHS